MDVQIFTNPELNYVKVLLPEHNDFSVLLYDLAGKCLVKKHFFGSVVLLNTENIKHGIYIINVTNDKKEILYSPLIIRQFVFKK